MKIELRDIHKSYGTTRVIEGVSLSIVPDELFFLLGPSGCGKTTLLRMIAGFLAPDGGDILFDGKRVNDFPPEKRNTPMVFQSYALWPHMSVFENVAYGLRVQGSQEKEIQTRSFEALEITRMKDFATRFPNQLSGGQQQRIAIARALAVNPSVLLFDEPLSNLDAKLRIEMREELLEIHRQRPFTAIYVTHDQEESMTMASRIAVLDKGKLHQVGTPQELYRMPKNRFVAEFMGSMNWFAGLVQEVRNNEWVLETPFGTLILPHSKTTSNEKKMLVGFRPSAARLHHGAGKIRIKAEILEAHYAGAAQRVWIRPLGNSMQTEHRFLVLETNPRSIRKKGEELEISLDAEDLMVLPHEY